VSVNATLIAAIGTLLLAMGVGVLIGRSGNNSSPSAKSPAVQVVTVGGASGGASGAAASTPTTPAATPASGGSSTAKPSGQAAGKPAAAAKPPAAPPKVVTVGSPGKGPGYQGGKFTGNFFGG
jgi:hypothetical protein